MQVKRPQVTGSEPNCFPIYFICFAYLYCNDEKSSFNFHHKIHMKHFKTYWFSAHISNAAAVKPYIRLKVIYLSFNSQTLYIDITLNGWRCTATKPIYFFGLTLLNTSCAHFFMSRWAKSQQYTLTNSALWHFLNNK